MDRLRAAAGVWLSLLPAVAAASVATQYEPAMQLTWQVSRPAASEAERDLLRREYRLSQSSGEFWAGFDGLNARIHATAELLRRLHASIEGTPPAARHRSLLDGLEEAAAEQSPPVAAPVLPQAAPAPAAQAGEAAWTAWLLLAAVLGGLTLYLLRRGAAGSPRPATLRRGDAVAVNASPPPVPVAAETPPAAEEGLKRHTVPTPAAAPAPVDPVREEMDHALDLAEVMLSYGRTTGAMQALKDYLRDHPAISVRPWLRLLELYRQTGMREDFDSAAEAVHGHFNVRVPHWDEGVAGVPLQSFFEDEEQAEILGLEQLPHILARIQATWPDEACREYLRHLLADNRGGGRQGFPVSVVADILLLEDILNDRLAGQT